MCLICFDVVNWFVDDEDEEVSGLMDPDSLDPGSVGGGRGGRRTPRALSPARVTRSPRPTSPARASSPAKLGRILLMALCIALAMLNCVRTNIYVLLYFSI